MQFTTHGIEDELFRAGFNIAIHSRQLQWLQIGFEGHGVQKVDSLDFVS
jgi:hypothetical protein